MVRRSGSIRALLGKELRATVAAKDEYIQEQHGEMEATRKELVKIENLAANGQAILITGHSAAVEELQAVNG